MVFTEIHVISSSVICLPRYTTKRTEKGNGILDISGLGLLGNKKTGRGNEASFTRIKFKENKEISTVSVQEQATIQKQIFETIDIFNL